MPIWSRLVESHDGGITINHRRKVNLGMVSALRQHPNVSAADKALLERLSSEHVSKDIRRVQYTQKSYATAISKLPVTAYLGTPQFGRMSVSMSVDLRNLNRQVKLACSARRGFSNYFPLISPPPF